MRVYSIMFSCITEQVDLYFDANDYGYTVPSLVYDYDVYVRVQVIHCREIVQFRRCSLMAMTRAMFLLHHEGDILNHCGTTGDSPFL